MFDFNKLFKHIFKYACCITATCIYQRNKVPVFTRLEFTFCEQST